MASNIENKLDELLTKVDGINGAVEKLAGRIEAVENRVEKLEGSPANRLGQTTVDQVITVALVEGFRGLAHRGGEAMGDNLFGPRQVQYLPISQS